MRKFFCVMILVAMIFVGGCSDRKDQSTLPISQPQIDQPKEKPTPVAQKPEPKPKTKPTAAPLTGEKQILLLKFNGHGGTSVSSSSCSVSVVNGNAQISFKLPEGADLLGNFNTDGSIAVQIVDNNGRGILFNETIDGYQQKVFNLASGNYGMNITKAGVTSGEIELLFIPR